MFNNIKIKYGIYGGAFDPPHIEHKNIALKSKQELSLEKIIILPSNNAPHKEIGVSFEHRYSMTKKTFTENCFIIDDIEKHSNLNNNYSFDILSILEKKYGAFIYIIGGDSLINIEKWYRFEDLLKKYKFAVVPRNKDRKIVKNKIQEFKVKYNSNIILLSFNGENLSSQIIRAKIMLQDDVNALCSDVLNYIEDNKIYNNYQSIIKKIKLVQKDRLIHIKNVVYKALEINTYLGLRFDKVFLSALLHDCAKGVAYNSKYTIPINSINTPVMHQFLGAEIAKYEYNILDEDILNAIKYHTTSCPNQDLLGKLIYVADIIEETRDFEGVEFLRKATVENFEKGYNECVKMVHEHLILSGKEMYELTNLAYKSLNFS